LSVASIEGQKAPYLIGNASTNESIAFITNSSDAYGNEIDFIGQIYEQLGKDKSEPLTLPYVVVGGVGNLMNYSMSIRRQLLSTPTVALVKRGDISFADKVQYAKDNGAVAVVIYNNLSGTIRMSLGDLVDPIPACSIGLEAGTNLVKNAVNGKGEITFSAGYTAGPFMSDFSSWGPTPSLNLKPEITAYGGKILSAVPGGYDQLSGTSMASPNMAGMITLMRQYVNENYGLTGKDLNARVYQLMMSTATMVLNDEGNPYSPRKQGSGLGSVQSAMSTKGYITVGNQSKTKIELFDDPKRTGVYDLEFTVHNISDGAISYMPKVYNMTETLAVDNLTVAEKSHMLSDTAVKIYVNDTLTDGRVSIPANSQVKVKISLTLGNDGRKYIEDSFENGMYVEGFVRFENGLDSANGKICDIGVPYLAFYGDWADAPMFDYTVYEVSESENDSSVEPEDKIKASAAATTPLGLYEDYYIIPLGSYVYAMEETDVAIDTSDERAAISMFNNDYAPYRAINKFYAVYAGMLRGAKEMEISIVDTVTGEDVFRNTVYNQRKSYAGGGSNIGSPVTMDIMPFEWDWNNNTQYELKLTGKLDWKREGSDELVSPEKNTFSFKFTVDYEAPTITDYRVRFEPYTENKETKYRIYLDVDVFDNQYSMAIMPCFIKDNTLYSLTHYPVPIYSQKNETTTVSFEITDYYEDYFKTGNMFLYPMDYAMNHTLYRVGESEAIEYPTEVKFETGDRLTASRIETVGSGENEYSYQAYRLTLAPNEAFKLVQTALPQGTVAHKLTWTSSSNSVRVYENEIFAGPNEATNVTLLLMAKDRILAKIALNVRGEAKPEPRLQALNFRPVENGDSYVAAVGDVLKLNNSTVTQLQVETTPWYYPDNTMTWSSDNNNVATVDENGVVTTKATGYAWITATSVAQPNISVSVQIVVPSDFEVRNYRLYNYYGGEICEIPDQLNVMYLDDECFRDNTIIRKVILPKTLTEIPELAFSGCVNLEEVVIPSSCVAILRGAFYGCESLKTITLSPFQNKVDNDVTVGSLTIGPAAFYGCTSLETINNPERMTTLGDGAFMGCYGLKSIDISGVRVAGAEVFSNCKNLENVTMSAKTQLGRSMFYSCSKLNNVEVKSDIIPYGLFAACINLTNVTFTNPDIKSIGQLAFYNCSSLKQITLPDGSYELGPNVFSGCTKLEKVTLSQNTYITNSLTLPFTSCVNLAAIEVATGNEHYSSVDGILYDNGKTTILFAPAMATFTEENVPSTVNRIGASAFAGKTNLTSIDLTKYVSVGEFALSNTGIRNVTIPADWTEIPEGLFYKADKLETVTFAGNNVKTIGADAFAYCTNLFNIELPDSIVEIGDSAFEYCTRVTNLRLDNVETFGSYVFAFTGISALNAPKAKTLADYAFAAMRNLATVTLGPVTEMGEGAFVDLGVNSDGEEVITGNTNIQTVVVLDGATVIGAYAFANTSVQDNLTRVTLPDTIKRIGEFAFCNRTNLRSVNLANVTEIGEQAFFGCEKLADVDLSSAEYIGMAAFAYTEALKTVNLTSAKEIGGSAFEQSGITTLTLPSARIIGAYAFSSTQLTTVIIPKSLDSYSYEELFQKINDAGDLEDVLGKRSLRLMRGAFMDIPTLTEFAVEEGNEVFFAEDGVLYANVKDGYVLVQYPAGRQAIEYEVKEGTVRINDGAFYADTCLKKVTLPVSLKSIGSFAFYDSKVEEYVFKAVEAPVLETEYMNTSSMYTSENENNLVFTNIISVFSTVYYANFGDFAALVVEKDHVMSNIKWIKDQGVSVDDIKYEAPVFNYKLTRPSNGIGYDTPIWRAYFSAENTSFTDYAADRTTTAAINAIEAINTADEIKNIVNGIEGKDAKLAKLNEISANYLQVAREAYNKIVDEEQKALVTEYGKLLASEQMVRSIKAELGSPVELKELKREGFYKTRYEEGEKFDPLDMKIIAIYADGSLLELTSNDYTLDKNGELKASDTTVTISYDGKSISLGIMVNGASPVDPVDPVGPSEPTPAKPNVGLIVGLSVGGAVIAAGVAVLVVLLLRKKKLAQNNKTDKTE